MIQEGVIEEVKDSCNDEVSTTCHIVLRLKKTRLQELNQSLMVHQDKKIHFPSMIV